MTRFAVRRFPHEIIRRRRGPDTVNAYGEAEPGTETLTALQANLQPISRDDLVLADGDRLRERITAYVPEPDALLAVRENAPSDHVLIQERGEFTVESSATWFGSHTRAILLREN